MLNLGLIKEFIRSVKERNRVTSLNLVSEKWGGGLIPAAFSVPISGSPLANRTTKSMNYGSYWIREVPLLPERGQIANSLFLLDYKKLVSTLSFFDLNCEVRKLRLSGIFDKKKTNKHSL